MIMPSFVRTMAAVLRLNQRVPRLGSWCTSINQNGLDRTGRTIVASQALTNIYRHIVGVSLASWSVSPPSSPAALSGQVTRGI
jgi:hypothetical protein